jgi:hypothetical protein
VRADKIDISEEIYKIMTSSCRFLRYTYATEEFTVVAKADIITKISQAMQYQRRRGKQVCKAGKSDGDACVDASDEPNIDVSSAEDSHMQNISTFPPMQCPTPNQTNTQSFRDCPLYVNVYLRDDSVTQLRTKSQQPFRVDDLTEQDFRNQAPRNNLDAQTSVIPYDFPRQEHTLNRSLPSQFIPTSTKNEINRLPSSNGICRRDIEKMYLLEFNAPLNIGDLVKKAFDDVFGGP